MYRSISPVLKIWGAKYSVSDRLTYLLSLPTANHTKLLLRKCLKESSFVRSEFLAMAAPRKRAALNSSMILRELQDDEEDLNSEYDSGSDFDIEGLSEIEGDVDNCNIGILFSI